MGTRAYPAGQAIPLGVRCSACCGAGKVEAWGASGVIGWVECSVCDGSGVKPRERFSRDTGNPRPDQRRGRATSGTGLAQSPAATL